MSAEEERRERARERFADFVARCEGSEAPDLDALLAAEPELAPELERMYHAWRRLEQGFAGLAADTRGGDGDDGWLDESDARRLERLNARGSHAGRYRVEGELGRGGMGVVREVFDEDLERRIAMKVAELSGARGTRSRAARLARFLREARITGRLQHPAIVPVHELGVGPEGEPFFTMPLVRGHDLRAVLRWTRDGQDGWSRTRALGVLHEVCNAVAYAHSRGVVHRDLKPANVMVGEYGAVHVVDWGLAKVLGEGEPDASAFGAQGADSGSRTRDDEVLGTPAYMPPEQARGGSADVDERADVYSLGAILYHLLAHAPPYADRAGSGQTTGVVEALLAGPPTPLAELAPTAPPELVAICRRAMAREPDERYASVQALGEDLRAWLEGRVVSAHDSRALTALRKWIARNRALAAALAVVIAGAPVLASLATYVAATRDDVAAAERQARAAEVEALLEAGFLELGEGDAERARRSFDAALVLDPASSEAWAGVTLAELDSDRAERALDTLAEAAHRGAALAELDLLRAEALRALGREDEARALEQRAGEPATPVGAYVLAERELARVHRGEAADRELAARLMLRAVQRSRSARPLYHYGLAHARGHAGEGEECAEAAEMLLSLWPDAPGALHWAGFAWSSMDRPDLALPSFERAVAAEPTNVIYRYSLARELRRAGEMERALAILRELAAGERPPAPVFESLSRLLSQLGEHDEAIAVARAGVRARPGRSRMHQTLAEALTSAGAAEEAVDSFDAALEGAQGSPAMRRTRARNLSAVGRHAEAEEQLLELIEELPEYAAARAELGVVREAAGDLQGSIEAAEEALRLDPDNATANITLGRHAERAGESERALEHYRRAAATEPDAAVPVYDIGCALLRLGRVDEAVEAFQVAVQRDGFLPEAHCNLGHALRDRGRFEEALAALRRGHELGSKRASWKYDSAEWVRELEALLASGPRIDAALAGEDEGSPAELAELAGYAREHGRVLDSARLFARALDEDPAVADEDLEEQLLMSAASAAARAALLEELGEDERADWRARAIDWLDLHLYQLGEALDSGALRPVQVRKAIDALRVEEELASLRDEAALAELDEDEAELLRALWTGLAELRALAAQ